MSKINFITFVHHIYLLHTALIVVIRAWYIFSYKYYRSMILTLTFRLMSSEMVLEMVEVD